MTEIEQLRQENERLRAENMHLKHLLKSFGYTTLVAYSLIALPLQGIPRKQGKSAFVDDEWNVLPDQWEYLSNCKCLSMDFVESKIQEWSIQQAIFTKADVGDEGGEISKPWEKKMALALEKSDVSEPLSLVLRV